MSQPTEVLNFSDGNGWGNGGWGGIIPGFIGGLFGGALLGNGFGGFGGNGNAGAAAALGAQATANNNTDLLMNAVNNVGAAVGQDFQQLNTSLTGIGSTLNGMAVTQATTPLQIANTIQQGNMSLQQQLSQCCCENRLATCEQTNTIVSAIKDQTVAMNEQFCALQQRELKAEINAKNETIAQLRDQAQTNTIQGSIALLQQAIAALAARIPATAAKSGAAA